MIVAFEGKSLAEVLGNLLRQKKATLGVAESCSGGLLADGRLVVIDCKRAFAVQADGKQPVVIVPAAVGPYTVRPHGPAVGSTCATVTAFVRGTGDDRYDPAP